MAKIRNKAKNRMLNGIEKRNTMFDRIGTAFFLTMFCVFPLYLNSHKYIEFTQHKTNFMFCAVILFVIIYAFVAVVTDEFRQSRYIEKRSFIDFVKQNLNIIDIAVLAFLFTSIISCILSPYKGEVQEVISIVLIGLDERFDGLFSTLCYVAIYFMLSRSFKIKDYHFVIFSLTAVAIGFIGIMQFFGHDFLNLFPYNLLNAEGTLEFPGMLGYQTHFRTTLGNINIVATYSCIACLVTLGFYTFGKLNKWRFVHLAGFIASVGLLITGGSQSGIVGFFAGIAFCLVFTFRSSNTVFRYILSAITTFITVWFFQDAKVKIPTTPLDVTSFVIFLAVIAAIIAADVFVKPEKIISWTENRSRELKIVIVIFAVVIVGSVVAVNIYGTTPDRGTIYEAREMMHGNFADDFGTHRIFIWKNALKVVPDNLFFGTGPDTFKFAFGEEGQAIAASKYNEVFDKAHNEYLQVLVCLGIFGLIPYVIVMIGSYIRGLIWHFKNREKYNAPIIVVIIALFGYSIQAIFNINVPITAPMFWVLAGVLTAMLNQQKMLNK